MLRSQDVVQLVNCPCISDIKFYKKFMLFNYLKELNGVEVKKKKKLQQKQSCVPIVKRKLSLNWSLLHVTKTCKWYDSIFHGLSYRGLRFHCGLVLHAECLPSYKLIHVL